MSSTASGPVAARRARPAAAGRPELLEDKLRVPRLSVAILRRGRLIDLIEKAAGHRVTVVSGPAGAGKTVACGSWASAPPASRRVAWLTLDAADRDPARFWAYVTAALTRGGVLPADAARVLQDAPADSFPLRVVEAAALLTEPVTLVLDDVHELADGPALAGLDLLIRHVPPALRLILSGRCPPRLQLARLRVSGDLADVNTADLACTPQEADAYFAMLGLDVDACARDELLRRTEGWMAGLRLAAMSVRSRVGDSGARITDITDIAGDEPLISDYLWDEVLGRQPARDPAVHAADQRHRADDRRPGRRAHRRAGRRPQAGAAQPGKQLRGDARRGHGPAAYRYHPLLRDVLAAERAGKSRTRSRPAAPGGPLARRARTGPSTRCAARPRPGTGTTGPACWPRPGPRRLRSRAPARSSRCSPCSRPSGGPTTPPWRPRWPRPGCGRATRTAPRRTWRPPPLAGPLRAGPADHRAVAGRAAGDAGRQPGRGRPRPAGPGLEPGGAGGGHAGSQAEHRVLGLLWFALGTARLRRWEIFEATRALDHATGSSPRAACSSCARGPAAGRPWPRPGTATSPRPRRCSASRRTGAVGGATPGSACLAALAAAQVSLARDDLGGARKLLGDLDEYAAGRHSSPGEPRAARGGRPDPGAHRAGRR